MALIPLNQKVDVVKHAVDEWGRLTETSRVTYPARVVESKSIKSTAGGQNAVYQKTANGGVHQVKIMLGGLVDITFDDTLEFTDELSHLYVFKPQKVDVERWFSGKVMFTVIHV